MKTFKIGTLIEFTMNGENDIGVIENILIEKDGYSYGVEGKSVVSKDIISAYRPIKPRAVTARKRSKAKNAQATA